MMKLETQRELLDRAREHLVARTTDLAEHCLSVRAPHYVGVEQLERELEACFRGHPLLVALSPDLPMRGSHVAHDAWEMPLLLTRAEDGVVRAFVNACRHRGARVAEGRGTRSRLTCPFHAWTYDLHGRVRARPLSCGGFDGIDQRFDSLREIPAHEVAGMIFILLDGNDICTQVDALTREVTAEVSDHDITGHEYFGARSAERRCNYKFIMDGFAEAYHIKALHKDTIAPYYHAAPGLFDVRGPIGRFIGVRSGIERELEKPPGEQRFLRYGTIQYMIPPNTVVVHQVDHVQYWSVYPIGREPGRCRVELKLYWPKPLDAEARRKAEFNLDVLWNVTTTEDFPQSDAIHANLASGALEELVFGRNEPCLIHYHEQIASLTGATDGCVRQL